VKGILFLKVWKQTARCEKDDEKKKGNTNVPDATVHYSLVPGYLRPSCCSLQSGVRRRRCKTQNTSAFLLAISAAATKTRTQTLP
jgi:hypothetical protein